MRPRKVAKAGSRLFSIRNRQTVRDVDLSLLRRVGRHLLGTHLQPAGFELCLHLVEEAEMRRVHQEFLQDDSPTDVITFDHSTLLESRPAPPTVRRGSSLHGEIYVCLNEALNQARKFRTTWQMELTRYLVHGLLHLCGYDDRDPQSRRRMKEVENRLVRRMAVEFPLASLRRARRLPRRRRAAPPQTRRD